MKAAILIISFLFIGFSAKGQGIEFFEGDFGMAQAMAEKEGKLLFIDCYTTWCTPCKVLDKEVFQNDKVGKYMNKKFICLRIDMETDAGLAMMRKYVITVYPTLIFGKVDGTEIKRVSGSMNPDEFITLAKGVVKPPKK
jgi:thiol:disulfide interchange protein